MNFPFAILPGVRAVQPRMRARPIADRSRLPGTLQSPISAVHKGSGAARGLHAAWRISPVTGRLELRWFIDDEIDGSFRSSMRLFLNRFALAVAIFGLRPAI